MTESWPCAYCGVDTRVGPWVDERGVGWMPCCWSVYCEERADRDAAEQLEARRVHGAGRNNLRF